MDDSWRDLYPPITTYCIDFHVIATITDSVCEGQGEREIERDLRTMLYMYNIQMRTSIVETNHQISMSGSRSSPPIFSSLPVWNNLLAPYCISEFYENPITSWNRGEWWAYAKPSTENDRAGISQQYRYGSATVIFRNRDRIKRTNEWDRE